MIREGRERFKSPRREIKEQNRAREEKELNQKGEKKKKRGQKKALTFGNGERKIEMKGKKINDFGGVAKTNKINYL